MIYLASPYSHPDARVREERFRQACVATAELLRLGHVVFSPIVHSHPLCEFGLPGDWSWWERVDGEMLRRCDRVVVLMIDGWIDSLGVAAEIAMAHELGKPVRYWLPPRPHSLRRVALEMES